MGPTEGQRLGSNWSWSMASRSSGLDTKARNQKQCPKEGSSLHGGKNESSIVDCLWPLWQSLTFANH